MIAKPHLAFLHSSAVHVPTFGALVEAIEPALPVRHVVREDLLDLALAAGRVTDSIANVVQRVVAQLVEQGAQIVVCTCSTLGDSAEAAREIGAARVMRIDRPMTEYACRSGKPLLVVAAVATALDAALGLLRDVTRTSSNAPRVRELLCAEAWPFFQRGDHPSYIANVVARVLREAEPDELVMLAQASLAAALEPLTQSSFQVIASPEIGVRTATEWFRSHSERSA